MSDSRSSGRDEGCIRHEADYKCTYDIRIEKEGDRDSVRRVREIEKAAIEMVTAETTEIEI